MNIQANPAAVDLVAIECRDNSIPIEAWNTVLFEKFCRFRYVLSHGLAGHSEEFFRRKSYAAGATSGAVSATRPGALRQRSGPAGKPWVSIAHRISSTSLDAKPPKHRYPTL